MIAHVKLTVQLGAYKSWDNMWIMSRHEVQAEILAKLTAIPWEHWKELRLLLPIVSLLRPAVYNTAALTITQHG